MEQITYGVKAVGHEASEPGRKVVQPSSELKTAFEMWLEHVRDHALLDDVYAEACEVLAKIKEVDIEQAHGLLHQYQNHSGFSNVGIFVSAVYNKSKEKVIVYEEDISGVCHLARHLHPAKCFVNKSRITNCGFGAEGLLINYGCISGIFGTEARKVLNYGSVDQTGVGCILTINMGAAEFIDTTDFFSEIISEVSINFGTCRQADVIKDGGVFVNCGELHKANEGSEYARFIAIINPHTPCIGDKTYIVPEHMCRMIPRVVTYFDKMRTRFEAGRNDVSAAIKALKTANNKRIRLDLENILTKAGLRW